MKYIKALILLLAISVVFSGCSFKLASSVNDLIEPVAPFGDNAAIKTAMDSYVKNGYSLKTPSSGKYRSSYSLYDIDGDGQQEAFAFYEPKDNLGTVDLAIIKRIDNQWQVIKNIKGEGKDIYSINFDDMNGDSKDEVLVCWDVISNSTNHILSVYKFKSSKGKYKLNRIGEPITINNYSTVDITGDGIKDLLLFIITSGTPSSAKAELYSLEYDSFLLMGETKLDSHITTYEKLQIEKVDGITRLYADAVGSDGESMTTELIYWSDTYDTIISPFYSYSTGLSRDTTRRLRLPCMDINSDKMIEIPSVYNIPMPKHVKAVNWSVFKNTTLIHSAYSLYCSTDNYCVMIDDKYIDIIKADYDEGSRRLTVSNKNTGNEVFSVIPVLKAVYDAADYPDYSIALEDAGYYYLAKSGNDTEYLLTLKQLTENIKSC